MSEVHLDTFRPICKEVPMETYNPDSPRVHTIGIKRPGIFGKRRSVKPEGEVPEYLKKIVSIDVEKPHKKFIPVMYWKNYLLDLERSGTSAEIVDRIRKEHEEWMRDHPVVESICECKNVNIPNSPDAVVVNITVSKSGKIKTSVEAPMELLYTKYYSNGVRPPIDEHIKALKKFGYPDEVLLKVLKKHQKRVERSDEDDMFIEKIFGKGGTKASKPKAKGIKEQISSLLKIKK